MITRKHRFHGYNALRSVYGRGQTVRAPLLNLKYATRESSRPYRVAVVVSRKVSKSAIVRNRIRRRIFEIVRSQERQVPAGLDLVFTVFGDDLASLEAKRLEAMVTGLLQQAARPARPELKLQPARGIVKSEGK